MNSNSSNSFNIFNTFNNQNESTNTQFPNFFTQSRKRALDTSEPLSNVINSPNKRSNALFDLSSGNLPISRKKRNFAELAEKRRTGNTAPVSHSPCKKTRVFAPAVDITAHSLSAAQPVTCRDLIVRPQNTAVRLIHSDSADFAESVFSAPRHSRWMLMAIGGAGEFDSTSHFFSLLSRCSRLSVVRCVNDPHTPLELLSTADSMSGSFDAMRQYVQRHSSNFAAFNLNMQYTNRCGADDASESVGDRQMVGSFGTGGSALRLWPVAMAYDKESGELVVVVCESRSDVPWEKLARLF